MKEINSISDISVDALKKDNYKVHFFGLGFIQVKIDSRNRFHFYHPELPAFVENPHSHRYNFTSKVLRGRLYNEVWEESKYSNSSQVEEIEYTSCQEDGKAIKVPDPYPAYVESMGSFEVNEGSSYYIGKDTFHSVRPDFSAGPCVTLLTRGVTQNEFAKVLSISVESCPFSKKISEDKLWEIVRDCIKPEITFYTENG